MTARFPSPSSTDRFLAPSAPLQHPIVAAVRAMWLAVLLATIAGALLAFGASKIVTPVYSATSTLYFSITYGASGADLNQGSTYAQDQMLSFAQLGRSALVLQPVIDSLDLELSPAELAGMMDVTATQNTVVLEIVARSADPALAAAIANETATSLTDSVRDVAPRTDAGRPTVEVRTVDDATAPSSPSAPNTRVNVIAGALLGLALSLVVIALMRLFDTRIRTAAALDAATAVPVLASIAVDPAAQGTEDREGVRRLLAMIGRGAQPSTRSKTVPARTIALCALSDGVTASQLSTQLAKELADSGDTVRLVRAGDRSQSAPAHPGVDVVDAWENVPAGAILPLARVRAALEPASTAHNWVLVDAASLAESATALLVGRLVQGVVLVVGDHGAHVGAVQQAMHDLAAAGVPVIGTVLTSRPTASHEHPARQTARAVLPLAHNNQA